VKKLRKIERQDLITHRCDYGSHVDGNVDTDDCDEPAVARYRWPKGRSKYTDWLYVCEQHDCSVWNDEHSKGKKVHESEYKPDTS